MAKDMIWQRHGAALAIAAAVLAVASGCGGKADSCMTKDDVLCASELALAKSELQSDQLPVLLVSAGDHGSQKFDEDDYKITETLDGPLGTKRTAPHFFGLIVASNSLPCPGRAKLNFTDAIPGRKSNQEVEGCVDSKCKFIDCKDWAAQAKIPFLINTPDLAKKASVQVQCEGLTFREHSKLLDITWKLKSAWSYKFEADPSKAKPGPIEPDLRAYNYGALAKFHNTLTKGSDVVSQLGPIQNEAEINSDTPYSMRLPLRYLLSDLTADPAVPPTTPAPVLQAGWTYGAYTVGCVVDQAAFLKIVSEVKTKEGALKTTDVVHILFSQLAMDQPLGSKYWCYYVADLNTPPTLKPFDGLSSGGKCEKLF